MAKSCKFRRNNGKDNDGIDKGKREAGSGKRHNTELKGWSKWFIVLMGPMSPYVLKRIMARLGDSIV